MKFFETAHNTIINLDKVEYFYINHLDFDEVTDYDFYVKTEKELFLFLTLSIKMENENFIFTLNRDIMKIIQSRLVEYIVCDEKNYISYSELRLFIIANIKKFAIEKQPNTQLND